ncbi:hypothetical protein [Campylobacter concisus]|uniref:hypothetical protein n=1 Tax=Campylobacter concisus TaxID=199 RepID=UPI0011E66D4A|nr:hypothetical protein [Campylobacter concisus]
MRNFDVEKLIRLIEGVSSNQNGLQEAILNLTEAVKNKIEEYNETFVLLSQKIERLEKHIRELENGDRN